MFTFDGMSVKMCNVHHNKVTSARQRIVQCSFKKNTNYQREENYLLLWLSKCKIILNLFPLLQGVFLLEILICYHI